MLLYIGTAAEADEEGGIYVCRMDAASGQLTHVSKTPGINHASFQAIHPSGRFLYSVGVSGQDRSGILRALAIDRSTGELTLLNEQSSRGAGPCHVSVDQTGRVLLAANYASGSVAALPIEDDGRLGEATGFVQHEGSSVNESRQTGPHAHMILPDPTNRFALSPDLGTDKVMIYRMDPDRGTLTPNDPAFLEIHAGAGPRHLAFHPNGRTLYVINELDDTMVACSYDSSAGRVEAIQTIKTVPDGFSGTNYCSDVHVSASGKFVYGSNRGHDSIVICAVAEDGTISVIGHEPTRGNFPRNFAIDPSGRLLLVANQNANNVVTLSIDSEGTLTPTGLEIEAPSPVCLKFLASR